MRDVAKYLGGLVLALVLLWWVVRGIDLTAVWDALRRASLVGVLLATVLNLSQNVFRVWRWGALLAPVRQRIPFRPMFTAVIVGYMTSWIVPGRLGELVRPLLLTAREKVPLGPCIGSVVADRLLDAVTVVVLFVIGSWITPLEGRAAEYGPLIRSGSLTMAAVVALLTAFLLLAASSGARMDRWLDRRSRPIRWIGRTIVSISTGVTALRSPRLVLQLAWYSALTWLTISLSVWVCVRSVGVELSFGAVLVIMPLLVLGVAVPTPGGAGSYHGAMKLGLMLFGASEVLAVSAGFLMHLLIVIPVIVLGVVLLWVDGISWRDLVTSAAHIRKLGAAEEQPALDRVVENTP